MVSSASLWLAQDGIVRLSDFTAGTEQPNGERELDAEQQAWLESLLLPDISS